MSWERLVTRAARRPAVTVAVVLALAIGGGLLALGLEPSASTDTFVSRSSPTYQATADFARHFGGDTVIILIREPLTDLVETADLGRLSQLEACLGGQVVVASQKLQSFTVVPASSHPTPYGGWASPCGHLMKMRPTQVVYGPATFLNQAVAAVNQNITALLTSSRQAVSQAGASAYQLALGRGRSRAQASRAARAAETLASQQETEQLITFYEQSGISGYPTIADPQFIPQIVFDATRGANQPKARFAYLFPTSNSALIQVRLKSTLSYAAESRAIAWIRQAVRMPMFRSAYGGTYTVTGAPVVVEDLASQITGSIGVLLIAALAVMAITLLLVFRSRLRLLPLLIALAAVGITFGITSIVGASLTMASIAVLPILIGLAVDYAIQFQSRVGEARRMAGPQNAVVRAAAAGAPTIATAALATATGFLVLLLSPVPMVRGFGVLLVIGIAIALVCALTAGAASLALADRTGTSGALGASMRGAADILRLGALAASVRGAGEILADAGRSSIGAGLRLGGALRRVVRLRRPRVTHRRTWLAGATARPERVLGLALVVAAVGWFADTQTSVQSDVTKLVPSTMPALRDLHALEHVTGVSGEIDVTVSAPDVTRLNIVRWMSGYEQSLLAHYGYLETKGCSQATLCPALSLPDLFAGGTRAGQGSASSLTQGQIDSLLSAVPSYFSQAVITPDHRNATLAFGIRLMPLAKQQRVIQYMNSRLHPPPGVSARLAGLPVLAAQANAALSSSGRRLLTLVVGLLAVAFVLLAVFRNPRRALVPVVPIALATGWSALILFLTRIPLNPMSATLGALVIAISTEFSVLLAERYRQERRAGYDREQALARTYRSTGRAVLASGITAIAGFGVLVASNITMLRDFGFVTLIDLTVSLGGVLLVLPAVLVAAEGGDLLEPARGFARRLDATTARLRRRPTPDDSGAPQQVRAGMASGAQPEA
jgi:hydrophobe/amphiphile efflux-3 (HAE3) family protein